ncbi:hypothetical protein GJV85_07080 [Sulfurimonas aquatica]|uniref:Uncharacterized protein n=1 Tax=Sulfurimonas aquatica TaxID=2672570 RepID=A0A975B0D3_9BACT|nr:hypothetical protein [Sulfurimonas aquatica]QSZ41879.1 hypothetical protein GJV85_07080 [Sulfurimonas aquatica]
MQLIYKYAILYFLLFSLALLVSGLVIFDDKIGLSYQSVLDYYLGNEEKFIVAKSPQGLLKIILPHIFSFGLFVMVILHFLAFTKHAKNKNVSILIYATFFVSFLELASPFLILQGVEFFAYVKIISFVTFEFLILYALWLVFDSIIND